jgi:uncharacterized coiled-coil protein SlyX
MFNEPTVEDVILSSQHPVLAKLNADLAEQVENNAQLTSRVETLNNQLRSYIAIADRKQVRINSVGDYLKEAIDDQEIEAEIAKKIADLLGLELTTTVEIKMTFEATASVTIPYGQDADIDSIASEFYAELRYGGLGDVESEDIEMTDWRDNS